ncbi:MAG: arginine--tRNA ligase, partial [Candidatus Wildermuthbacteria bacterium]|nr:arginine--tRNA ligase [Candidatus Wildermuthbacteria bacterium]
INFFLSKEYFLTELEKIARQEDSYGRGSDWKGKKVIVEFTDPNPFKEFHIGHLYSNAVGESIARLFEWSGAKVKRANYQGDVGLHVAKAILGMKLLSEEMPKAKDELFKKAQWLGKCYALGAGSHEENNNVLAERNRLVQAGELERINAALYQKSDTEVNRLYDTGRKWSLDYFEEIYKILGTKFDFYYFESNAAKEGIKIVQEGLKKGVFQESQGAVIFPGEKHGLHNRVFINSLGLPTYEAKELGLAPTKYKDFKYDLSVIVTGNEITEYFRVLLYAMKQIFPDLAEKTRHIPHGMVRLPEGKMSSRTGNVISGLALIQELEYYVEQVIKSSGSEIGKKDSKTSKQIIAVAAAKYWLLRVGIGKDIVFETEKSLSITGESGPYIQYTFARCQSILEKSKGTRKSNPAYEFNKEEAEVMRALLKFPEVVKEAAQRFSPNLVATFAFDLAQKYNLFYNTHSVLSAKTREAQAFRVLLTKATSQILKSSLNLLGIQTLDRM